MAEKATIVIKKKVQGGHGGAHGGAWKVAYADFVTAMMAFFLVMWLMGSDDEIKASVAHYFNHPNTPFKAGADPFSKEVHPMGEKEGSGNSVMSGSVGLWPEDLIERPKPVREVMREARTISQMLEDLLEGEIYGVDVNEERARFSIPDHVLFDPASSVLSADAKRTLDIIGQAIKNFKGTITIAGYTDEQAYEGGKGQTNWELSFGRAVAVMRYLRQKHGISEERMVPTANGPRRALASNKTLEGRAKNRRVEFTLNYEVTD